MGAFKEWAIEQMERDMGKVRKMVSDEISGNDAKSESLVKSSANRIVNSLYADRGMDVDFIVNEVCYEHGIKNDTRIRMVAE